MSRRDPAARADLQVHIAASRKIMRMSSRRFQRLRELAEPKKAFCDPNDPGLRWGNQEPIWILSPAALTARPSPRIVALAQPKRDFDGRPQRRPLYLYSCGRESGIWERLPLLCLGLPSERLRSLSEPKRLLAAHVRQRPRQSPVWPVTPGTLRCVASPRVLQLAQPKELPAAFLPAREVQTRVTSAAASASPSWRLQRLAEPRTRTETCCYERGSPEAPIRPVSRAARQAVASPRILELAAARRLLPDYMPLRDAEWPVCKAATRAVPSPRLVELAQPRKRLSMDLTQFNPDAFVVKEAAMKAVCSARLQDLARPVKH